MKKSKYVRPILELAAVAAFIADIDQRYRDEVREGARLHLLEFRAKCVAKMKAIKEEFELP